MAQHLITWITEEQHVATVDTEQLARLTGHPIADVAALVRNRDFGALESTLGEIEDDDTFQSCLDRTVDTVGTDPTVE